MCAQKKTIICILRAGDVTHISRIHRTALALHERGVQDVVLLSVEPRHGVACKEHRYTTTTIPIRSRALKGNLFAPLRALEGLFRLAFRAAQLKANLYIACAFEDLLIAFVLTRFRRAKLMYNSNELEADRVRTNLRWMNTLLNQIVARTEAFILKRADAVVAADTERAKWMEQHYKIPRVETVRNVPVYQRCSNDELLRKELRIPKHQKILLYQGALVPGRGLEASIVAAVNARSQPVALVLLGPVLSAYRTHLESISRKHGFNRLHFLSPVPWEDLLLWTSSADVSLVLIENVSMSYYLAAPNKLYESIMAEVPYIASAFPEIQRVHKVARAGILVDPTDSSATARAIDELLSNGDFRHECMRNARKAKRILCWENEKDTLLSVVDRCF